MTATQFADAYGPWAIVAGASDGTGAAFARELSRRGLNVVLVARRTELLRSVAATLPTETRVVTLDLSTDDAAGHLADATADLDVGMLVYNAGADPHASPFLGQPNADLRGLVVRNCLTVLELSHRIGQRLVDRGRGGLLLVSSAGAWAGGGGIAAYGATKAFDLILGEGLWAEWHHLGVDVLSLVLGATDTPSLRRMLAAQGRSFGDLADPDEVAREGLDHVTDGPTWMVGFPDPTGPSPFDGLPRRQAVELLTELSSAGQRPTGVPVRGRTTGKG